MIAIWAKLLEQLILPRQYRCRHPRQGSTPRTNNTHLQIHIHRQLVLRLLASMVPQQHIQDMAIHLVTLAPLRCPRLPRESIPKYRRMHHRPMIHSMLLSRPDLAEVEGYTHLERHPHNIATRIITQKHRVRPKELKIHRLIFPDRLVALLVLTQRLSNFRRPLSHLSTHLLAVVAQPVCPRVVMVRCQFPLHDPQNMAS